MDTARDRILARLRQGRSGEQAPQEDTAQAHREWLARQPSIGDLSERFAFEQEAVGSHVRRVPDWSALEALVPPWLAEHQVASIITGSETRLESLRDHLASRGGFTLHRYDQEMEQQRETVFGVDCGITTSHAGIADTGSIILIPSPAEPRLLSLAPPVHLVLVETGRLYATLTGFIEQGGYQGELPTNLVLVSGASRTADIELTLAMGVHGPKVLLVALIG